MNIMKRMRDISVATLNDKLERSEDPVKLIDQFLISQKEQIGQSEKLYQQCIQHTHTMKLQYLSAEQTMLKREEQAKIAVRAGEESLARAALAEKMVYEEKTLQYQKLYEQGQQSLQELESQLQQMKVDLNEILSKRQFYMARLESIRLQRRMNERNKYSHVSGSSNVFSRLEEKVSDLEWEVRSLKDVRAFDKEAWKHAGNGIKDHVEKELDLLRFKLKEEGWIKK